MESGKAGSPTGVPTVLDDAAMLMPTMELLQSSVSAQLTSVGLFGSLGLFFSALIPVLLMMTVPDGVVPVPVSVTVKFTTLSG